MGHAKKQLIANTFVGRGARAWANRGHALSGEGLSTLEHRRGL